MRDSRLFEGPALCLALMAELSETIYTPIDFNFQKEKKGQIIHAMRQLQFYDIQPLHIICYDSLVKKF